MFAGLPCIEDVLLSRFCGLTGDKATDFLRDSGQECVRLGRSSLLTNSGENVPSIYEFSEVSRNSDFGAPHCGQAKVSP